MLVNLKRKLIVIFGGSGFIGSHLAKRLLNMGASVIIADKKMPVKTNAVVNSKVKFLKTNITNMQSVKRALSEGAYVFNLAGCLPFSSKHNEYLKNSIDINLKGALNVALACIEKRVKKLIFTSGYVVYGIPGYLPIDEVHPTDPIDIYGASKLAAEKYLSVLLKKNPYPELVILRLATVYGPRQLTKGLIPNLFRAALDDSQVKINAMGKERRDYLFIDDAVNSLVLSLTDGINGIYNIGSGKSVSVNQVKEIIEGLSGKRLNARYSKEKGLIPEVRLSNKLAETRLNYKPNIAIKNGLRLTYHWYKDNIPKIKK